MPGPLVCWLMYRFCASSDQVMLPVTGVGEGDGDADADGDVETDGDGDGAGVACAHTGTGKAASTIVSGPNANHANFEGLGTLRLS